MPLRVAFYENLTPTAKSQFGRPHETHTYLFKGDGLFFQKSSVCGWLLKIDIFTAMV